MRYAEGLHQEWGLLAPPPSFTRTIRMAAIATIIGAAAGAFLVVNHSHDGTSVAARTLIMQQFPSAPLSPEVSSRSSPSASRNEPITAYEQKKGTKKHSGGPHYASIGHWFSSFEGSLVPCHWALVLLATTSHNLQDARVEISLEA
jgi:hypothetical protein